MKKFLSSYSNAAIVFLLISLTNCLAQTPLNKVSELGFLQQSPFSITKVDNSYWLYCQSSRKDSNSPNEREVLLVELDSNLDIIDHHILMDNNDYDGLQNSSHDLIHIDQKLYAQVIEDDSGTTGAEYVGIFEFDMATESFRYFDQIFIDSLYNVAPFPVNIALDINNESLLALYVPREINTNVNSLWLRRYDLETGEVVDEYRYTEGDNWVTGKEIITSDNGIVLISNRLDVSTNRNEMLVMQLDNQLNEVSRLKLSDTIYSGIYNDGVVAEDGSILFNTIQVEGDFPTETFRSRVIKLDAELNIVWNVAYGRPDFADSYVQATEIIETHQHDGYLICGGTFYNDPQGREMGVIGKISDTGDSLWFRHYEPLEEETPVFSFLEDIILGDEGEYIGLGRMSSSVSIEEDSIYGKIWTVVIDESGHIVTSTSTLEEVKTEIPTIRIFPNPTTDYLYIEHDEASGYSYELYDNEGRLLLERNETETYHTYILNTSSFSPGLYYLHIIDAKRKRQIKEIVVQN